jgi:hypothetical protein
MRPLDGVELIAEPCGLLEVELRRRGRHVGLELGEHRSRLAVEERREPVHELAMVVDPDLPGARRRAAVDVEQQAGPARPRCPVVDPLAAGADREDPQEQVERLADRVRVRVRAEAAVPLAHLAPLDAGPGDLLRGGEDEVGVGLVVAVADVVPRAVPLDQRVLEVQRRDLRVDHDPVDRPRRLEHRAGPRRDVVPGLEVVAQPLPQGLRLPRRRRHGRARP